MRACSDISCNTTVVISSQIKHYSLLHQSTNRLVEYFYYNGLPPSKAHRCGYWDSVARYVHRLDSTEPVGKKKVEAISRAWYCNRQNVKDAAQHSMQLSEPEFRMWLGQSQVAYINKVHLTTYMMSM